jgi:hypothetical protein
MPPLDLLAQEQIEDIVGHLWVSKDALQSLSLVSHIFLQAARAVLYRNIRITNVDKAHTLTRLLGATRCTIPKVIDNLDIVLGVRPQRAGIESSIRLAVGFVELLLTQISARRRLILQMTWNGTPFASAHAYGQCPGLRLPGISCLHWPTPNPSWSILQEFALIGRFSHLADFIDAVSNMSLLENLLVYAHWQHEHIPGGGNLKVPPRLKELRVSGASQALLGWILSSTTGSPSLTLIKVTGWRDPGLFIVDTHTIQLLFEKVFVGEQPSCLWIDNRDEGTGK